MTIYRADEQGQTALHMAVLNDHVDVAAYLLAQDWQGILIREASKDGKTPLHVAAEQGPCITSSNKTTLIYEL